MFSLPMCLAYLAPPCLALPCLALFAVFWVSVNGEGGGYWGGGRRRRRWGYPIPAEVRRGLRGLRYGGMCCVVLLAYAVAYVWCVGEGRGGGEATGGGVGSGRSRKGGVGGGGGRAEGLWIGDGSVGVEGWMIGRGVVGDGGWGVRGWGTGGGGGCGREVV